ncbi:sporulation protein rmd1 [Entomophthora muscae]|uniref:Sporulation protein rmd1 n=1 Tax=Entomophthora muscae TaxID=34485 RepID=A0ACC2SRJ0_9FUNG|nr:sporulation protein rmd1 [Entomophthora muscae]
MSNKNTPRKYASIPDNPESYPSYNSHPSASNETTPLQQKAKLKVFAGKGETKNKVSSQVVGNQAKLPPRTTKVSQKLAFFPEHDQPIILPEEISDDEVYNQITQIPAGTVRKQAQQYSKKLKQKLPRVTSYSTAGSYKLDSLLKYFQTQRTQYGCAPKIFDECLYTPFNFSRLNVPGQVTIPLSELGSFENENSETASALDSDSENIIDIALPGMGEVFIFDYGVTVLWGLTQKQEQEVLRFLKPFEEDKIDEDDIETDEFHFHYNSSSQPKIYNDVITLRSSTSYLVKMTISHAIAQSTKMALFENLVSETIEDTKHIPQTMAETGKVNMARTSIAKKIGQLYIMKINVNLVSNILDTPEIFWSEPQLQPLYNTIRGYLEIPQRAELLNQRVDVICDMLDMLREHLNSSHGEFLEWIVIILIGFEILIGIITIFFEALNLANGSKNNGHL